LKKINFALIGSGWRAEFFIRIAKALPEQFNLCGVMIRDSEKGKTFAAQHNVLVVNTLNDLLKASPDFVVLSIARGKTIVVLKELMTRGIPVLCETPPAETTEELNQLWNDFQNCKGKVQVAEQYFLQPLYSAWENAIQRGLLGTVQNINISSLHGYHGISIIRRFLGESFQNCTVFGKRYQCSVIETLGRSGLVENGELHTYPRDRLTLEFDDGKVAFFDFSDPAQYHSLIRTRQLTVQGERGEIDDLSIRYISAKNIPVAQDLRRIDFGTFNNQEWSHYGLFLGEEALYKSPVFGARLNDDEIGVASCLLGMDEYLKTGKEFYPLKEALQDTYLAIVMQQAVKQDNEKIHTTTQSWAEK
jgi:predicted dehydrogenase